ncbi:J domain-containing protein [Pseudomonas sp. NPDC088444]|uniref:J domain-containing protein n=1 Tax=Pseudomonas sp. NPDC088444 TaxID=3364456 RepID=UPI00384BA1E6
MNPWTVLGLEDDADERTVKRQYAKLLKVTRPDDDPEAFQRLREAYERALDWARNRVDDEDDVDTPTAAVARPMEALIESASIEKPPAPQDTLLVNRVMPAPDAATVARQTVHQLVDETTAQNIPEQHQNAVEHNCDLPFQQRLLERCLDDAHTDNDLLSAAVAHLRWLTPWQTLRLSADQEVQLTHQLLDIEGPVLEQMLSEGQERAFLAALDTLTQQPWLASLERRDQFQRWTMFFLHNHKGWTAALFDRICALFGWDDRKGIFPQPEFIWRHLIERCEKYAYIEHWQRRVASGRTDSVEDKAAMLVLKPGRKVDRLRLARFCSADVWVTCERLCSTINNRYPEMLDRFPQADLKSWRELQVAPLNPSVWTWFGWLLFSLFFMIPNEMMKGPLEGSKAALILLLYPVIMTGICRVFMRVWRPISLAVENTDEWISDKVLPEWLHWPASQALLIRHGVPLAVGGVVVAQQGFPALVCYGLLMSAWFFLSPYRHPHIYAQVRGAVRRFWHVHFRKLSLSAVAIAAFAMSLVLNPSASKTPTNPATATSPSFTSPVASASQLDCYSQQSIELMEKECRHSLVPQRCTNETREQKISRCLRLKNRLQSELQTQSD